MSTYSSKSELYFSLILTWTLVQTSIFMPLLSWENLISGRLVPLVMAIVAICFIYQMRKELTKRRIALGIALCGALTLLGGLMTLVGLSARYTPINPNRGYIGLIIGGSSLMIALLIAILPNSKGSNQAIEPRR